MEAKNFANFGDTGDSRKDLKIDQFAKGREDKYNFKSKKLNRVYTNDDFHILAKDVVYDVRGLICFDMTVTYDKIQYSISIVYTKDDEIYYGSHDDSWEEFKSINPNLDSFDTLTDEIIESIVPCDFWEVQSTLN